MGNERGAPIGSGDQRAPRDVRTPLHAIRGNAELVLASEASHLSADGRLCLTQIVDAVADLEAVLLDTDMEVDADVSRGRMPCGDGAD